jgi:hypothetical protein
MLSRRLHRLSSDRLLTEFLLAVLLLRALVPAGFMPVPDAAGASALTMQMCSVAGPRTVAVKLDGEESPPPSIPRIHDGGFCAFAVSAMSAPPPVVFRSVLPIQGAPELIPPAVAIALVASIPRTHSPRAPPILA